MRQPKTFHIILFPLMFFLSACGQIFETSADVQAKKTLMQLMDLQTKYHQENHKYARNVLDLQKYDLKYNAGVVYLEIESADENKYRAIALPAESTTARVFAFDTDKGGMYEMQEDEVKAYVLGALRHIRVQQRDVAAKDYISFLLAGFLGIMGIKSLAKNAEKKFAATFVCYFTSIFPMTWSLILLNHLNKNIVFSRSILLGVVGALASSLLILVVGGVNIAKLSKNESYSELQGLLISALAGSIFSCVMMAYILRHFYTP